MKWIMRFIYMVAGGILLGTIAIVFYRTYQVSSSEFDNTAFKLEAEKALEAPGIIHAVGIDMDRNKIVNYQSGRNGNDSLLVIKADAKSMKDITGETESNKLYIFNGMALATIDTNNFDGWLYPSHVLFNDLQILSLARYTSEKRLSALQAAGVSALFFNPEYIEQVQKNVEPVDGLVIGYAVMSDSSQHIIKIVDIPASILQ